MIALKNNVLVALCIPTRNRPDRLSACLEAAWNSEYKPCSVIVSDDSPAKAMRETNRQIVSRYSGTTYLVGPRQGLSANRNNAVSAVDSVSLVAFIDDDVLIDSDLIANAVKRHLLLSEDERSKAILSGVSRTDSGMLSTPVKLNFRGYFCSSDNPQSAETKTAFFPRNLFYDEQWDENIFIGQEDAELCLRALKNGYKILHCPELQALDTGFGHSTLNETKDDKLTDYEIYIAASRLYIGIKRYRCIYPNPIKLSAFVTAFFCHMSVYLMRRKSLGLLPEIVRRANVSWL